MLSKFFDFVYFDLSQLVFGNFLVVLHVFPTDVYIYFLIFQYFLFYLYFVFFVYIYIWGLKMGKNINYLKSTSLEVQGFTWPK